MKPIKKKLSYQASLREAKTLSDKLGYPLDAKILPLVAALRMYGVRTTASCQGHQKRGLPYPWVDIDHRDSRLASRLVAGSDHDKHKTVRGIMHRERTWVFEPGPSRLKLVPRDVEVPLRTLQARALRLAERIKDW